MQKTLEELSRYRATGFDSLVIVLATSAELGARVETCVGDAARVQALTPEKGLALLEAAPRRGVVLVEVTPGTPEWDEWLVRMGSLCTRQPVVLVSQDTSARAVVEAFRSGVVDVLVEPDDAQLRASIDRVIMRRPAQALDSASQRWATAALAAVKPKDTAPDPDVILVRALDELIRVTGAPAGSALVRGTETILTPIPREAGEESHDLGDEETELLARAPHGDAIRFVSSSAATGNHLWGILSVPIRSFDGQIALLAIRVGETARRRLQFERAELAFFAEEVARAWGAARLQLLIHSAKQEYESIVDSTTDCLLLLDDSLRVRRVNRATAQGLGRDFGDILGRPFMELFPEVQAVDVGAAAIGPFLSSAARAEGVSSRLEVTSFLKPGDIFEIHAYPGPVQGRGRLTVLFAKDVGNVKRLQRQLIQSEKLASLGTLAAGVAHEINNPVGYVTSNLRRLREYMADIATVLARVHDGACVAELPSRDDALTLVGAIRKEWKRLDIDELLEDAQAIFTECFEGLDHVGVIVRNLKQYAASGAPREPDLQLKHVAEGALRLVWNKLKYNVRVEQKLTDTPPIVGSSVELMQVLVNLLVNAADATEGRDGEVVIETRPQDGGAAVIIKDNGSGIDPKNIDRIFDPFFTTKPPGRGTGLGLAISAEILNRHGARVDVRSQPGEGTAFHVWFPAASPGTTGGSR